MDNQLVSDAEVDKALDWLRDNAAEIGEAKRLAVLSDHMVKHVKAIAMKLHGELPVSAQEREALASEQYKKAIEEAAAASGVFETMKSLREAAQSKIEVYRSSSANYRAMKL